MNNGGFGGPALPFPNLTLPDGWTAQLGTYPSTVDPATWSAAFGESYTASPDGGTFVRAVAGAPNFRNSATPDELLQVITGLVPGVPVKVEFWATIGGFENENPGVRTLVSGPGFWQVSLGAESTSSKVLFDPNPDATRDWVLVSETFTPAASEELLRLRASRFSTNANAGAYMAIDGVRVICDVPTPPTATATATSTRQPVTNQTPTSGVITVTAVPSATPTATPTTTLTPLPLTPTATITATPTPTSTATTTPTPTPTAVRITPEVPTVPPIDPTSTPFPTPTATSDSEPTPIPTIVQERRAELRFSANANRQFAARLDGREFRAGDDIYVFLAVLDNEQDIMNVKFKLDGEHVQTRGRPPWDLLGQNEDNLANPISFTEGDVGHHELIAIVRVSRSQNVEGPEETRQQGSEAVTVYAEFEINTD